jgi:glucan phosphoethanolaminetransferase (alkaline phosphatase superfamily)
MVSDSVNVDMARKQALCWSLIFLGIGLTTPSLVIFYLEVFIGGIGPLTSVSNILGRQFAEGHNLFYIALFGLIPFAVLSIVCLNAARHLESSRLGCVAVGGLLGILSLMIWGHVAVWYPLYAGGRTSSTAVIAFVVVPFYCLASMLVGLIAGWAVSLLPAFRSRI